MNKELSKAICFMAMTVTVTIFADSFWCWCGKRDGSYHFDWRLREAEGKVLLDIDERRIDGFGVGHSVSISTLQAENELPGNGLMENAKHLASAFGTLPWPPTREDYLRIKATFESAEGVSMRWIGNKIDAVPIGGTTLERIVTDCRNFSELYRKSVLAMKSLDGVKYAEKRFKVREQGVRVGYVDVLGSPRLYEDVCVSFRAHLKQWSSEFYLIRSTKDVAFDPFAFLSIIRFSPEPKDPAADEVFLSMANKDVIVTGCVTLDENGDVRISKYKLRLCDEGCGVDAFTADEDECVSMTYASPCNEFRLRLKKGNSVQNVAYVGGRLSILDELVDETGESHGIDHSRSVFLDIAASPHWMSDLIELISMRLKRLASGLGLSECEGLCVSRKYSAIPVIEIDAEENSIIAGLVDDLRNCWTAGKCCLYFGAH